MYSNFLAPVLHKTSLKSATIYIPTFNPEKKKTDVDVSAILDTIYNELAPSVVCSTSHETVMDADGRVYSAPIARVYVRYRTSGELRRIIRTIKKLYPRPLVVCK